MKIRYFRVTDDAVVHRVAQRHIEGAFLERRRWSSPGDTGPLRIVTFICDRRLLPVEAYFLRLQVEQGRISNDCRFELVAFIQAMAAAERGMGAAEARLIGQQQAGWPTRGVILPALAQALDVPVAHLPEFYLGGPLVLGLPVEEAVSYCAR